MTLCRLFGVRIRLNSYFLVLLAGLAWAGLLAEAGLLFGIVLLHELTHVLAAKSSGLAVAEVELLPFGGVARIDDLLEADPPVEVKVALSGPLANAVLIGAAWAASRLGWLTWEQATPFVEANAIIGGFNLIPALPLDGGRAYRAWLAQRLGFRRATEQAVRLGTVCAAAMTAAGVALLLRGYASVSLIVVAAFVYHAAGKERDQAAYALWRYLARRRRQLRSARRITGFFCPHQLVAGQEEPLKGLLAHLVPQRYHIVWVVDGGGRVVGIAHEADVIDALFQRGATTPVGALATPLGRGSPGSA